MNAAMTLYEEQEFAYRVKIRCSNGPKRTKSANRPRYGRSRGQQPVLFNGIHRRRKKRIMW